MSNASGSNKKLVISRITSIVSTPDIDEFSREKISKLHHYNQTVLNERPTKHRIHPIFVHRTSCRSMCGQQLTDEELEALFEAARWAPSHFNAQPWRFIYARKTEPEEWHKLFNLLVPLNQKWAERGSVLVLAVGHKFVKFNGHDLELRNCSFEVGAAVQNMLLEGCARGLVAHVVGGFDHFQAYETFNLDPKTHRVEVMIVLGKRLKDHEDWIMPRRPLEDFVGCCKYPDTDELFNVNY